MANDLPRRLRCSPAPHPYGVGVPSAQVPSLMGVPEAAWRLAVHPNTLRGWIASGALRAARPMRNYKVSRDALLQWQRARRMEIYPAASLLHAELLAHCSAPADGAPFSGLLGTEAAPLAAAVEELLTLHHTTLAPSGVLHLAPDAPASWHGRVLHLLLRSPLDAFPCGPSPCPDCGAPAHGQPVYLGSARAAVSTRRAASLDPGGQLQLSVVHHALDLRCSACGASTPWLMHAREPTS